MCGRFALSAKTSQIEKLLPGLKIDSDINPRYNIAPSQKVKVILNTKPDQILEAHWGLLPSWAKDKTLASKLINARVETLLEKPSFKNSFKNKRCLILADAFYEWKQDRTTKSKIPYLIKMKSGEPFTFAGLWDIWVDKQSQEKQEILSTTIITTEPNELMAEIHNRMPVIIPENLRNVWLDPDSDPVELQKLISIPFDSNEMVAFQVSKIVNNPSFDDISCTYPVIQIL
jgi:putative SOS response-associated peptidase YedK